MGDADVGKITPGVEPIWCSLISTHPVHTLNNPLRHIVFSSSRTALRSTMVGGRWVLRDGKVTGIDEAAIFAEARELGQSVVTRHDEAFELARHCSLR